MLGCCEVCNMIELFAQKHLFLAYDTHLNILKHIKCTYGLRGAGLECIFRNLWLAAVQTWVVRVISVVHDSNLVMTEVLVFICFKKNFPAWSGFWTVPCFRTQSWWSWLCWSSCWGFTPSSTSTWAPNWTWTRTWTEEPEEPQSNLRGRKPCYNQERVLHQQSLSTRPAC